MRREILQRHTVVPSVETFDTIAVLDPVVRMNVPERRIEEQAEVT
jgi:hypothetical protein